MPTNILAMPRVLVTIITGTNEDWIDSLKYVLDDVGTPLDLTGIDLEMEIRKTPPDADVVITANSLTDGYISVGGENSNMIVISVPLAIMKEVPANGYVGDIIAKADGYQRRVVQITELLVERGITRGQPR